jgi:hypothetical protein
MSLLGGGMRMENQQVVSAKQLLDLLHKVN